jgi:hypothetical protein
MAASPPHLYLASDEANFTDGGDLVVDGGRTEL